MLGSPLETVVKTTLSFLKVCEDWLLERVDVEPSPTGIQDPQERLRGWLE